MKEKSGMKSARMPQEHFEKTVNDISVANAKYASQSTMDNPEDLHKAATGLASFVKSHRMKY
jgi:hypothetical protein